MKISRDARKKDHRILYPPNAGFCMLDRTKWFELLRDAIRKKSIIVSHPNLQTRQRTKLEQPQRLRVL